MTQWHSLQLLTNCETGIMTLWVSDWQSESDLASIRNSFDFSWNWYVPFRVATRFTSEDLSNFSFYMFLFHVNFQCLFIFTMFHARRTIPFSFKYLSLFCPRPSQKTEPQVFIYFLLSNTHNMFRQYALVIWYLIYDWQNQKNTINHIRSTLNSHFLWQ